MQIIFVVGPTASGKSALALSAAEKYSGAIINCDSIQLNQGLNIGSAKPSKHDFSRVPHFLFDVVPLGQEITAGEYSRLFFEQVEKIKNQFPSIFVVGGTGFYFQAIEKGMYPIGAANEDIKQAVEAELKTEAGAAQLYTELQKMDPEAAKKIAPKDHYRLGRAIEIIRTHGKSVTDVKKDFADQAKPFPYPLKKYGIKISKEELLPRVEQRTKQMLNRGLLDEVQFLIDAGYSHWSALQSVGYQECLEFLRGEISSRRELEEKIIMNTMRLAKKQRTWFQRDGEIQWLSPTGSIEL
jgi:tRNA dimethylallyltransferase